jgi:hypothetical protein
MIVINQSINNPASTQEISNRMRHRKESNVCKVILFA